MPNQIPIDPKLPNNFNTTPNEERSKDELDRWWDHPYCLTMPDGRFEVWCLNGGAWDRASWLGRADTYREACELADRKQSSWVMRREEPVVYMDSLNGPFHVIRKSYRPDMKDEVVATFATMEECSKHLEQMAAQKPKGED